MNPHGDPAAASRSGLCWYGLQKFPALLDALVREIPGVRRGEDIEYIHRMRVASRRLRAALPLFRACFPAKEYRVWMRGIAKLTRALGEARDADVQMAFLQKLQKRSGRRMRQPVAGLPGGGSAESPAVSFLLAGLQTRRAILQDHVLAALDELEACGVINALQQELSALSAGFKQTRRRPLLHGLPPVAALRISRRLSRLLSFDPWVRQPEAVAEHHAARIAAKKLRYTMEVYGALYRRGLSKPLARVKRIQEILGAIHDDDVWIAHVTQILLRERTRLRHSRRGTRPDTGTLASLALFLRHRETDRQRKYHRFVRFWDSLGQGGLWTGLLASLDSGRKNRVRPVRSRSPGETAAIAAVADRNPGPALHSRHVSRLAVMLFDALMPLHGLGGRDRMLLESAGLLHDIGWDGGRAGHGRRGALSVFAEESIPFDIQERCIICTAIASHRGRRDPASLPFFSLMLPENRQRALMLAAILRIADGLDCRHTRAVTGIGCTFVADKIFCEVSGTGDLGPEKERARLRGDLFARVFRTRPVIR